MAKTKPYLFVFDGKFLNADSILELRTELSNEDWYALMEQTIEFYAQLKSISGKKVQALKLNKQDVRIMRSLKRTIDFIETIDPVNFNQIGLNDRVAKYTAMVDEEIKQHQTTLKISLDGETSADIMVSRLD